jgi:uncharacterized membrane protein
MQLAWFLEFCSIWFTGPKWVTVVLCFLVQILMSALKRQDVNVQNVSAKTHGVVMIASAPVAFSIFTNMTFASVSLIFPLILPECYCCVRILHKYMCR